jgi:hypothetical protein
VQASRIDPGKLDFIIDAYGEPEAVTGIDNGKIGGLMRFREQVLGPAASALNDLAQSIVTQVNTVHQSGIDAQGQLGGALFGFVAGQPTGAAQMNLLIQDANRVAAAGQFRVMDAPLNTGTAQARIQYAAPEFEGPTALSGDLALAQVPQVATINVRIEASQGFASLGRIPIGTQDLSLTLKAPGPGQTLQVISRDGRHLLGSALSQAQQSQLLKPANGLEAGATYQARQINGLAPDTYLGMDIFMGAKATATSVQQFNAVTGEAQSPLLMAASLVGQSFVNTDGDIAAGALRLNGQDLPSLSGPLSLQKVVDWINTATAGDSATDRIVATAINDRLVLSRPSGNTSADIRLGLGSGTPADLLRLGFDTRISIQGATPDDLLVFVTDTQATAGNSHSTASISGKLPSKTPSAPNSMMTISANLMARISESLGNFSPNCPPKAENRKNGRINSNAHRLTSKSLSALALILNRITRISDCLKMLSLNAPNN